jgi:para-nitrobenzyl esterase
VDGKVIPDKPNLLFTKRRQHAVPVIVGNTRDEMSLFLMLTKMPADEAAYAKQLKDEFGDLADAVATVYPAQDGRQIRSAVIQLSGDLSFVSEARFVARVHSTAGQKAFRYQFSRGTKRGFLQGLGAHHGAELAFLFQRPFARDDKDEMGMSRTLGRYWINFAATGNPNGPGLPTWPAYRADAEEMADFGDGVNILKAYRTAQLDVIEKVLDATRK